MMRVAWSREWLPSWSLELGGLPVAKEEGALPFLKGACSLNPKAGLLISMLCLCGLFSRRLCFLSVIPAASFMGSNSPRIGLHPHF